MSYSFNELIPRRGTHSIKWDTAENAETLPMWIADMDFRTFPPLVEAAARAAAIGHYGYNTVPNDFFEAIISWWQRRHNCKIEKDWILPSTGVVAGISAAITSLLNQDDEVIVQTPAYNHFFNVIAGCRCITVTNDLIYDKGDYSIDFEDLEAKAASGKAKILLLCNPHNPVGRAWTEQELERVASICGKNNLLVISDEIHSDLLYLNRVHIPFISVAAKFNLPTVTCSSASKTFNLSGLHAAYLFVKDTDLRKKIEKQLWAQASGTPPLIACEALTVSYNQGEEWLSDLKEYLYENYQFLKTFFAQYLSHIRVIPLEATYLVWLDCSETGTRSALLAKMILEKENLWVNEGDMYGVCGESFLRINIACPREVLLEGLRRLRNVLANLPSRKEEDIISQGK